MITGLFFSESGSIRPWCMVVASAVLLVAFYVFLYGLDALLQK